MNISTYESRIKALEDQLNPPTTVIAKGVQSVIISPAIGDSETVLAEAFPFEYEEGSNTKSVTINGTPTEPFTVTIMPGSEYYAEFLHGTGAAPVDGDAPGAPISTTIEENLYNELLIIGVSDISDPSSPYVQATISFAMQD